MKKFLFTMLGGLLLFIAVNRIMAFFFPLDRIDNYYSLFPDKKASLIFFGDSQPNILRHTDLPENFAMFSAGSDNFIDMTNKLEYGLSAGHVNPGDTIMLQVGLHMFAKYRLSMNNNDLSPGLKITSFDDFEWWMLARLPLMFPSHWRFVNAKNFRFAEKPAVDYNKVSVIPMATTTDSAEVRARYKTLFSGMLKKVYIREFKTFVGMCKENDLHIIGIRFPHTPYINQLIKTNPQAARVRIIQEQVLAGYKILDYLARFPKKEWFYDPDHLNADGVKVFLDQLDKDLYDE